MSLPSLNNALLSTQNLLTQVETCPVMATSSSPQIVDPCEGLELYKPTLTFSAIFLGTSVGSVLKFNAECHSWYNKMRAFFICVNYVHDVINQQLSKIFEVYRRLLYEHHAKLILCLPA